LINSTPTFHYLTDFHARQRFDSSRKAGFHRQIPPPVSLYTKEAHPVHAYFAFNSKQIHIPVRWKYRFALTFLGMKNPLPQVLVLESSASLDCLGESPTALIFLRQDFLEGGETGSKAPS